MQVKVKDQSGLVFTVTVEPTSTVLDIKKKICSQTNVPVEQQNLLFSGQSLSDDSTVQGKGITRGTNLFLTTDLRNYGGGGDDDDDDDEASENSSSSKAEVAQKDDHQTVNEIPNEHLLGETDFIEMINKIKQRKHETVDFIRVTLTHINNEISLVDACPEADDLEEKADGLRVQSVEFRNSAKRCAKHKNYKQAQSQREQALELSGEADKLEAQAIGIRSNVDLRVAAAEKKKWNFKTSLFELEQKCSARMQELTSLENSATEDEEY